MSLRNHLVTGATDGIGLETAAELARRGARVLVHGRTEAKARAAVKALAARGQAALVPVWGDLGELHQVRALAEQVRQEAAVLDVLLNNAGVFLQERQLSADGHELTFAVNHLSHFLLTHLLWPNLRAAPQGRVVNVASGVHASGEVRLDDLELTKGYSGYGAYAASKLMNVLFTHELTRRLGGTAVTTSALHPGVINTKLLREGFGASGAAVAEGARTSVYCALAPELAQVTGRYYSGGREVPCAARANDPALERALYEKSCVLTGVEPLPTVPFRPAGG
jgi:NAD(P)-dependent dehydrogenase (short-subunit alcohol dehydrogenase family)